MNMVISIIYSASDQFKSLCDYAASDDESSLTDWIISQLFGSEELAFDIQSSSFDVINVTRGDDIYFFEYNSESKPTSGQHMDSNWPFEGYGLLAAGTSLCQDLITAQDMAFGTYDEDKYVRFLMKMNEEYPGAGTQLPVRNSVQWYSATYYWPNVTPLPPIGHSLLKGIVTGQLFDPATPYIWTQKMRDNFKSTTLLTSRSVNHGISSARESISGDVHCFDNILRYFKNGVVDFLDGTVCAVSMISIALLVLIDRDLIHTLLLSFYSQAMPIGDSCSISDILNAGRCESEINATEIITTESTATPAAIA